MAKKAPICGIVSEFNPFHYGHAALLREVRQQGYSHVVTVMSGNFVQRGEPAAFSKWSRTEMALQNGVDLVLELPLPWALSGAERFAFGGVSCLNALGCVDALAFGSECGDLVPLWKAAELLNTPAFQSAVRNQLQSGISFAAARQAAAEELIGSEEASIFQGPNNILGIEYCKALLRLSSSLRPIAVKRIGAAHDEETPLSAEAVPSASQLRRALGEGLDISPYLPSASAEIIRREISLKKAPAQIDKLEPAILSTLRRMPQKAFSALPDLSEGIENRFFHAVHTAENLEELYALVKSKRYSHSRIRRLVLSAFLGIPGGLPDTPPYLRILGANDRGLDILRAAKVTTNLPIISNSSDILSLDKNARTVFELECMSSDQYALAQPHIQPCGLDFTSKFVRDY